MGSHASRRIELNHTGRILDALRRIVRHLRVVARESEAQAGIAPAQLFVLSRLTDQPAESVRELATRTLTDPSSVSVVLSKLEAKKLVVRKLDPRDKRRAQIALTAKGRAALGRAPEPPQVRLVTAIGALPAARRRVLADALVEVVAALGAGRVEPQLFFEDASPSAIERVAKRASKRAVEGGAKRKGSKRHGR